MASQLTNMVHFDIFYFTAFQLPFLSICQAWAHSFTTQRQFPIKVKGKTLIDFSSVIEGLKFVRILCPVPAQWMGMCLRLDFGVAFLCSATTGGNLQICGCSLDLKLWFPCSLNHPHWGAWAWAWISSCLSKSPVCQPNASLWRPLGAQLEQAASWWGELNLICCSGSRVYKSDWSFPLGCGILSVHLFDIW